MSIKVLFHIDSSTTVCDEKQIQLILRANTDTLFEYNVTISGSTSSQLLTILSGLSLYRASAREEKSDRNRENAEKERV